MGQARHERTATHQDPQTLDLSFLRRGTRVGSFQGLPLRRGHERVHSLRRHHPSQRRHAMCVRLRADAGKHRLHLSLLLPAQPRRRTHVDRRVHHRQGSQRDRALPTFRRNLARRREVQRHGRLCVERQRRDVAAGGSDLRSATPRPLAPAGRRPAVTQPRRPPTRRPGSGRTC